MWTQREIGGHLWESVWGLNSGYQACSKCPYLPSHLTVLSSILRATFTKKTAALEENPGFKSQYPYESSQAAVTPALRDSMPSSDYSRALWAHGAFTGKMFMLKLHLRARETAVSIGCSPRGWFDTKSPHVGSQLWTPVPGKLVPSLGLCQLSAHGADTHTLKKQKKSTSFRRPNIF